MIWSSFYVLDLLFGGVVELLVFLGDAFGPGDDGLD